MVFYTDLNFNASHILTNSCTYKYNGRVSIFMALRAFNIL